MAQSTFDELRAFWSSAYKAFEPFGTDIEGAFNSWVPRVLASDRLAAFPGDVHFSNKAPEPFFGRWTNSAGKLDLATKTVVVLINPGDGIEWQHYTDPAISTVGLPFWRILKSFYVNGHVSHAGSKHWLPYKRSLRNSTFNYLAAGRLFAWGWWARQWANMLAAMDDRDRNEEDVFVTLELFAYSTPTAGALSGDLVKAIRSSMLVSVLVSELLLDRCAGPRGIVLVNKAGLWREVLRPHGFQLVESETRNHGGAPRAYFLQFNGAPSKIPAVVLHQAQGMKFPRAGSPAVDELFARWRCPTK